MGRRFRGRRWLSDHVEVIVEALGNTDPVVIVAQSMGGLAAPLVCERRSVDLVVLVNAMIPLPGETGFAWWATTGQSAARMARVRLGAAALAAASVLFLL